MSSLFGQANDPPVVSLTQSSFEWISSSELKVTPSCDDDGLPEGVTKNTAWDILSGPESGAVLTPVGPHSAVVSFLESGDYVFRYIADDGQFESSSEFFVEVTQSGIRGYGAVDVSKKSYDLARQVWSDLKTNCYTEGKVHNNMVGFDDSAFRVQEDTEVLVTLLYDGASYRSSLSWFDANQRTEVYPIWSDVATGVDAPLEQGSTVSLGLLPAGTDVRFLLTQDGARGGSELISQEASENVEASELVAARFSFGEGDCRFVAFEDQVSGDKSFDDVVLQIHFVKQGQAEHQMQRDTSDVSMLHSDRGSRGVSNLLNSQDIASYENEVLGGVFQMPSEPSEYALRFIDDRSSMKFSLGFCALDHVVGLPEYGLVFRDLGVASGVVVMDDRLVDPGDEIIFKPQDYGLLGRRVFLFLIPNNTKEVYLRNPWRYSARGDGNSTKRQPLFSIQAANPEAKDQFLIFSDESKTVLAIEDHSRAMNIEEVGTISDDSFDDIQIVVTPPLVETAHHSAYYGKTIDFTLGHEFSTGLDTSLLHYDAEIIMKNAQGSRRWDLLFSSLTQTDGQFLVSEFGESLPIAESGAISVNIDWEEGARADFFIEQQRYGADLIETGIILEDRDLIADGIKMLDWGWARQGSDGAFPGSGDEVHSASLFLEAVSRAGLALKRYKPKTYRRTVRKWRRKTHLLAHWFVIADDVGAENNLEPFGHRYFLRGAALEQASRFTRDKGLEVWADEYMELGIARQLNDGSMLERGVFDASYQMVGMAFAGRYFAAARNNDLRSDVSLSIWLGVSRFLADVETTGEVNIEPLSRTATEVSRSGAAKSFDFKHMTKALVFAEEGLLMPGAEAAAELILEFYDVLE